MGNWDDRRYFLELARQGSVNRAAKKLGVNRTTVQRRITSLEAELSVRLFERLPDGYFLTVDGEAMLAAVEPVEKIMNSADRRLAGRDTKLSGTIRVSAPAPLAAYVLMPDFAAFRQLHPDIQLDLKTSFEMPDLARRHSDVAIRISNDPPQDLVGRRVLRIARAIYQKKGTQSDVIADPKEWISWTRAQASVQWMAESGLGEKPVGTVISDPFSTVAALRAGMGVSVLPCFMGDQEPDLTREKPGEIVAHTDLWVLTHEDLRRTARIRTFTEFIGKALQNHRRLLEGVAQSDMHSAQG